MLRRNRSRRALIRSRRRLGWNTETHANLCECRDCNALYGAIHRPLCRCDECFAPTFILGMMTQFQLSLMLRYGPDLLQPSEGEVTSDGVER